MANKPSNITHGVITYYLLVFQNIMQTVIISIIVNKKLKTGV